MDSHLLKISKVATERRKGSEYRKENAFVLHIPTFWSHIKPSTEH